MEGYMFTDNGAYLTEDQRNFYDKNGYIVLKNLVNHDLLDECQQRFLDICNKTTSHNVLLVMKDQSLKKDSNIKGEYLINKLQDWLRDEILYKYASDKNIIKVVSSIIGDDITGINSMLINKPPNAAEEFSKHPLHQDLHYFPMRPAHKIVASWTAMELIDEQNGCLFVVPGSHKWALFNHDYPKNSSYNLYHIAIGYEKIPTVNVVMEKGDTVFFHPLLLHGSGPNKSKGFRKAISVHYANSHCEFVDAENTSQAKVAKEVEKMAAKTSGGFPISFHDTWKYKSRVVQGDIGNFEIQSKL